MRAARARDLMEGFPWAAGVGFLAGALLALGSACSGGGGNVRDASVQRDAHVSQDAGGGDGGTVEDEIIPHHRRIPWAGHVGIPGGIPTRTVVCETLDAAAYGDGVTDATAAIQAALDGCGDDEVVLLPAGTYRVTATLQVRSRRVLRGEGMGVTVISFQGPLGSRSGVAMSGWPRFTTGETSVSILSGATKGSTRISLANPPEAVVGDLLLIDQRNDGELVTSEGVQAKCTHCGREDGDRTLGQIVEITHIDGSDVSFNIPLYFTYSADLLPEASPAPVRSFIRWAGLEELTVTQPEPAATYLVEMQGTQFSWLRNVEVEWAHWRLVWMLQSLQNEIRGSLFHESLSGYGRSHGYGVLLDLFSSANLVEDNIFFTLDGGFMMTAGGAAGNVFGYNYMEDSRFDDAWWLTSSPSLNHAPHPMMNLWEGNVGYQASGDFIWGSSSHNTIYRSVSRGWQEETITANNNAISFATGNTHMNVVGCVLGTPGHSNRYEVLPGQVYDNREVAIWQLGIMHGVEDPAVAATLLRHGNFDHVTGEVVWDPAILPRSLPASLYLAAKPSWFGSLAWPPIGPDVPGYATPIPAQARFEAMIGQ